jgi:Mce-associated membrane protein
VAINAATAARLATTPTSGDEDSSAGSGEVPVEEGAQDEQSSTEHTDHSVDTAPETNGESPRRDGNATPILRLALGFLAVAAVGLSALSVWLGVAAHRSHQADQQRAVFLQAGRQAALNLTTIDWQQADTDVERILDSATGQFHDDFSQRSGPFVDVVKQARSKSDGTVTEAGVESESADQAQILVAVTVKTSLNGAPDGAPRSWRMRIDVQQVGSDAKVSNVEFVP